METNELLSRESLAGYDPARLEKAIVLRTLDNLWREHIIMLEHLRQVIGLRGYGQRDPLNEYKSEAFVLFEAMLAKLRAAGKMPLARLADEWASAHAGGNTSFAIRKDGLLQYWGLFPGQPGAYNPGQVSNSTDKDWVMVTGGTDTSQFTNTGAVIALKKDGSLWTWGSSASGMLGRDCPPDPAGQTCRLTPGRVGTSNAWTFVSAGLFNALAMRSDGTLWTWGDNYYGEAGYGGVSGLVFDRPSQMETGKYRTAAAGWNFAVGIDRNYRLRAWGYNFYGQAGTGDQANRNRPTLVAQ